jgi:Rrf2 family nitric oxide-sensitive transcriptional repressor
MNGPFSISEAYSIALHLSLRLARQPENYCSTRAVAASFGFSVHHVAKVVQKLVHGGILETVRGIQGGARLARPAGDMTLMAIAEALGETPPEGCLLRKTVCAGRRCLLGQVIEEQNARMRAVLHETTLQTLADSLVTETGGPTRCKPRRKRRETKDCRN